MDHELNRRQFHKLTAAALGGLVAGSIVGCGGEEEAEEQPQAQPPTGDEQPQPPTETEPTVADNPMLEEPHVCRGLNTCEGQGAGGDNACAGQGSCATVEAHTCAGANACEGQGGCQGNWGENACDGQGGCHVPLNDAAWPQARARFEELWQQAGREMPLGEPPPPSS